MSTPDFNPKPMQALIFFLLVSGMLALTPAMAAEPKTGGDGGAAIRKAQGLIRQLSQEKSALEAEKTTLMNDKSALETKLKSLEETVKKLQPLQSEVEQYKTSLESTRNNLEGQLGQERQQRQALLQKHNDVVLKANAIFADNQLLVAAVKEREQWITQCIAQNKDLQAVNLEIVKKYQDKGFFQAVYRPGADRNRNRG
ncbi:MAG: hypothetical protein ABSB19_09060 [Methylomonas sp.]